MLLWCWIRCRLTIKWPVVIFPGCASNYARSMWDTGILLRFHMEKAQVPPVGKSFINTPENLQRTKIITWLNLSFVRRPTTTVVMTLLQVPLHIPGLFCKGQITRNSVHDGSPVTSLIDNVGRNSLGSDYEGEQGIEAVRSTNLGGRTVVNPTKLVPTQLGLGGRNQCLRGSCNAHMH